MINVSTTSSYRTKAVATYNPDLQQFKDLIVTFKMAQFVKAVFLAKTDP
jgi:hypothetical protein